MSSEIAQRMLRRLFCHAERGVALNSDGVVVLRFTRAAKFMTLREHLRTPRRWHLAVDALRMLAVLGKAMGRRPTAVRAAHSGTSGGS